VWVSPQAVHVCGFLALDEVRAAIVSALTDRADTIACGKAREPDRLAAPGIARQSRAPPDRRCGLGRARSIVCRPGIETRHKLSF
jgi:hypothetical protein